MTAPWVFDPPSFAFGFASCAFVIAYIVHLALRRPKP